MSEEYARDMKGYGQTIPDAKWPNNAKIAISKEVAAAQRPSKKRKKTILLFNIFIFNLINYSLS